MNCPLVPSHIHCNQLKIFSITKFSIRDLHQIRFVANFLDPPGGTVQNVWFLSPHFALFLLSVCKQLPTPDTFLVLRLINVYNGSSVTHSTVM